MMDSNGLARTSIVLCVLAIFSLVQYATSFNRDEAGNLNELDFQESDLEEFFNETAAGPLTEDVFIPAGEIKPLYQAPRRGIFRRVSNCTSCVTCAR